MENQNSRIVKSDSKGQVVIPKEIRDKLSIDTGTGFFVYKISNNEILLKKIDEPKINKTAIKRRILNRT